MIGTLSAFATRACALAACVVLSSCAGGATRSHAPHWSYSGANGPSHWSELSSDYAACAGSRQSPVDLHHAVDARLPPIAFDHRAGGHTLLHTGHALQVEFEPGSAIEIEGRRFELLQIHFHAPGENTIEGRRFPLEAHLVHADAHGKLVVVSVLFTRGERENGALAALGTGVPSRAGGRGTLANPLSAAALLPADRAYYRYEGSLTTPPCTEGVTWLVMKHPLHATRAQLDAIAAVSKTNRRPVQPLNGRIVLE